MYLFISIIPCKISKFIIGVRHVFFSERSRFYPRKAFINRETCPIFCRNLHEKWVLPQLGKRRLQRGVATSRTPMTTSVWKDQVKSIKSTHGSIAYVLLQKFAREMSFAELGNRGLQRGVAGPRSPMKTSVWKDQVTSIKPTHAWQYSILVTFDI